MISAIEQGGEFKQRTDPHKPWLSIFGARIRPLPLVPKIFPLKNVAVEAHRTGRIVRPEKQFMKRFAFESLEWRRSSRLESVEERDVVRRHIRHVDVQRFQFQ